MSPRPSSLSSQPNLTVQATLPATRPVWLRETTPKASQQSAFALCALRVSLTGHHDNASPTAASSNGKARFQ